MSRFSYRLLSISLIFIASDTLSLFANASDTLATRLASGLSLARRDDGNTSSGPWVYPNGIPTAPSCMSVSANCPYTPYTSKSQWCITRRCTMTFFGACMQWAEMIDKSCLCKNLDLNQCLGCSRAKERSSYLYWLNATCGDVGGWDGLPKGWENTDFGPHSFLWVGDSTENEYGYSDGYGAYDRLFNRDLAIWPMVCANETCTEIQPAYRPPVFLRSACPEFLSLAWADSLYDETQRARVDHSNADRESYYKHYIERIQFCRSIVDLADGACNIRGRRTAVMLWASSICDTPSYQGFPRGWRDSMAILGSGFINSTDLEIDAPDCLSSNCRSTLNRTAGRCASMRCTLSSNTSCDAVSEAIDMPCFCREGWSIPKFRHTLSSTYKVRSEIPVDLS